jgi:hypothetical protein
MGGMNDPAIIGLGFIETLCYLASLRLQHRFIRDATRESYVLPDELLDDVHGSVQAAKRSKSLTAEQRRAFEELEGVLNAANPNLDRADFIDADPDWVMLRNAALICVENLGFDLMQFEANEIAE